MPNSKTRKKKGRAAKALHLSVFDNHYSVLLIPIVLLTSSRGKYNQLESTYTTSWTQRHFNADVPILHLRFTGISP